MAETSSGADSSAGPQYYRASNRVGAGLAVWFAVVGGAGAVVLGAVYAFLSYLAHVLDLSGVLILVTPFFAAGLGLVTGWVCTLGEVRRPAWRLPIGLFVGVMGLYASWHVYLNFARSDTPDMFDPKPAWLMGPAGVWHGMRDASEGFLSWCMWGIEAATVFGFIAYLMPEAAPELPFCERCGHWTKEIFSIEMGDKTDVREEFKKGHMEALEKLGPRNFGKNSFTQVRVWRCVNGCSHFASLEAVTVTPGKSGHVSFGPVVTGGKGRMHYRAGTPKTNEVKVVVRYLTIDMGVEKRLEGIREKLRERE